MARLAIIHDRMPGGDWRPVGVILGTRMRLDFKFLPDQTGRQRWAEGIVERASPPYKDGIGLSPERGTWEDWIEWAVGSFSNGHDTWLTQIDTPEATVDANFTKYVLGAEPDLTPSPLRPVDDEIPDLGGFRKVTPS